MSRFPTMIAPSVLPKTSVSQANLGSAPQFTGLGLDRALEGIAMGAQRAAGAFQQMQDREKDLADQQARRDQIARDAQVNTWLADFQSGTITGLADAQRSALAQPIPLRVDAFDAEVLARKEQLETNVEDPESRAKANLWLTQIAQRGRESLLDQNARDTSDAALASLVGLKGTLEEQIASGAIDPRAAQAVYGDRLRSLTGTALSQQTAATMAETGSASFYARQADTLYARAGTDPDANRALREFIAQPEAKRYLDQGAMTSMEANLDKMLTKAEQSYAARALAAAQRSVSEVLPRGQSPATWWAANPPMKAEMEMNDIVRYVMEQPGTRMPGGLVEGRSATEGDVRERLFVPALKASAAIGDTQGFEMFVRLLRPQGNIEANASPQTEEIIADQARLMGDRQTKVDLVDRAKQSIDTVWAKGGTGVGNPAFRSQKALDQWADEKLMTDPMASVGDVARFAVNAGSLMPTVVRRTIDEGFGDGSTAQQTAQALDTLRSVQSMDPLAADRMASSTKAGLAARAMLNLPSGITNDEQAAQTLMSADGRAGVAFAQDALTGKVEGFDANLASAAKANGVEAVYATLPATARNGFEAAFAFRVAQVVERGGVESLTGDKAKKTLDAAAKQAMQDVLSSFATVEVFDLRPSMMTPTTDWNSTMMVDPKLYGLTTGSRNGADSAFGAFLEKGRSRFDELGFMGLDFNVFNSQDVRPDLGFVGEWDPFDSLGQSVAVPIIDRTSLQPTGFLLWDPLNQREIGTVSPAESDRFKSLSTRFLQSSNVELRDPERPYRRPAGSQSGYMGQASPLVAERFQQYVRRQAMALGYAGAQLDEYVDERAIELGWDGFAAPMPVEATK